jgi:membrane associated rhomboid family serine protease
MGDGLRLVATGTGVALAVAMPAALAAQVIDALDESTGTPTAVLLLAPAVLAGAFVGGVVVGRHRPPHAVALGAVAGLLALGVVLALGVARRLVADEVVAWSAVPAWLVAGAALGALGALPARRRAGRKRP